MKSTLPPPAPVDEKASPAPKGRAGLAGTPFPPRRTLVWIGLPLALLVVVLLWFVQSRTGIVELSPLPIGRSVPHFSLTRQDGMTVTRAALEGKVWVADFIFTRCPGPCPLLSARMRSLQTSLLDRKDEVRLVSFSVDPKYDTPSVLRHYAKQFKADGELWWFLTTQDRGEMHELITKGLYQSLFPKTEEHDLIHSNYFVVIDRKGRIRSAYDGLEPGSTRAVLNDVKRLLAEPFAP